MDQVGDRPRGHDVDQHMVAAPWLRLRASFGYSQQVASDFAFLFPLEQMPAFTAGFLAFHTIRNVKPGRVPYVGEAALAAGVSALLWQFHLDVHHIARVSLCLCVIVSAIGLGAGRYLVNPAIIHIGRISYSAYFVHFALLGTAEELAARYASPGAGALAVSLAFVLATTFAISTVTYATVERPLIKIGRAVIKSLLLPKARTAATA